ncbi:MAG TPA: SGNH/GDSL hydrolase family protein [Candidatus Acidoferrum sp.]|nr:SGNH/GDSL hydrolase family protein [Candidatus Acidoferrum sp.]
MTGSHATRLAGSLLGAALTLSACSATPVAGNRPPAPAATPIVYAAIGASETYGIGANDRYRQAWPQVFYNDVLPSSAILYNFGIPGATTAQALHDEVPAAVAIHPTVVTVWLNVNDLIRGVSPADYEAQLRQLLHTVRRGGKAQVLVANTPDLGQLPAYRACLPNAPVSGPACVIPNGLVPTPQAVSAAVNAYNAAISQAAQQEGATLVDLHLNDAQLSQHPEWLSADGFHPNEQGYAVIAKLFEDAYRRAA